MTAILHLITETEQWRKAHKAYGRSIEAAACAIRIQALKDAVNALRKEKG